MRNLASLSLTLLLAGSFACAGAGKKDANDGIEQDPIEYEDPPEKEGDKEEDNKPKHLTVSAMKLNVGEQVIEIKEDGKVVTNGTDLGIIKPSGEFLAANEALFATLMPDGSMVNAYTDLSRFKGIHVSKTGVLVKKNDAGEEVALNQISETGEVSEGEGRPVAFVIEGPAEGRQAAMFVYLVLATNSAPKPETKPETQPTPEGGGTDASTSP